MPTACRKALLFATGLLLTTANSWAQADPETIPPGGRSGVGVQTDGDKEQYKSPPPPIVRRLEPAGWDVIKINRNNLYERGWASSDVRHRDDAIERAHAAKASGYRNVILAGESYGGETVCRAPQPVPRGRRHARVRQQRPVLESLWISARGKP